MNTLSLKGIAAATFENVASLELRVKEHSLFVDVSSYVPILRLILYFSP
jgi:hypothetical protein